MRRRHRILIGGRGLRADYQHFRSVAELQKGGFPLAVIKFGLMTDHYVTVLDVNERSVTVGEPFRGKRIYRVEEFAKEWRFKGIVLTTDAAAVGGGIASRELKAAPVGPL